MYRCSQIQLTRKKMEWGKKLRNPFVENKRPYSDYSIKKIKQVSNWLPLQTCDSKTHQLVKLSQVVGLCILLHERKIVEPSVSLMSFFLVWTSTRAGARSRRGLGSGNSHSSRFFLCDRLCSTTSPSHVLQLPLCLLYFL